MTFNDWVLLREADDKDDRPLVTKYRGPVCPACGRKMTVLSAKDDKDGTAICRGDGCPSRDGGWPTRRVGKRWMTVASLRKRAGL